MSETATTLTRVSHERYGRNYWAVHDGQRAVYLEEITNATGTIAGVYQCKVAAEPEGGVRPFGEVQVCPYLGHCTTDAFGRKETDKVRAVLFTSEDWSDTAYVLLTDLHISAGA